MSTELFRGGGRYRAVRIPAIAAVGSHLIVIAVGRRRISDWGPSDLLIRVSADGGETWSPARVLERGWWRTVDNPTLVVDRLGRVQLFFQSGYRRLWQRTSTDGGLSFGPRVDRSSVMRAVDFRADRFAPGPGAGALMASGRVVIPVWAASGRRHRPSATLTIVSDDDGMTWRPGELVAGPRGRFPNPSEATVAPTADGGAVLSFRQRAVRSRVFSWSPDGATAWSPPQPVAELFEPVSHAALAATGGRIAFLNPDSRGSATPMLRDGKAPRENLTLRWSGDAGRSWGPPIVLDAGPSGYVSAAPDASGGLHVVWEHGRLRGTSLWPTSIEYLRITRVGRPSSGASSPRVR